jgi:hypothetical protein
VEVVFAELDEELATYGCALFIGHFFLLQIIPVIDYNFTANFS